MLKATPQQLAQQYFDTDFDQLDPNILEQNGYQLVKEIGKGSQGTVYLALKGNKQFAIKTIDQNVLQSQPILVFYLMSEILTMENVKSPHTVRLYDAFYGPDLYYLVMEYCPQNLLVYLHDKTQRKGLDEEQAKKDFFQILQGMIAVHKQGFVHRDIKPENILIGADQVIKIADFGFSKSFNESMLRTVCGTDEFMAPELLMKSKAEYDFKVDVWSLGVVLFMMIFYKFPFQHTQKKSQIDAIMQHVSQQKEFNIDEYPFNKLEHVEKLKKLSPACKDLFRRMFVLDPDARIDFYELARHEMFKELYAKDNEYTAEVEQLYSSNSKILKTLVDQRKKEGSRMGELARQPGSKIIKSRSAIQPPQSLHKLEAVKIQKPTDAGQRSLPHDEEDLSTFSNLGSIDEDGSVQKVPVIEIHINHFKMEDLHQLKEFQSVLKDEKALMQQLKEFNIFNSTALSEGESQYQEHLLRYQHESNKYRYLKLVSVQLEQQFENEVKDCRSALRYLLLRVQCLIANDLRKQLLLQRANTYNLPNWNGFLSSKSFQAIEKIIQSEYDAFLAQRSALYKKALEEQSKNPQVLAGIVEVQEETNFQDFKIPYRLVLHSVAEKFMRAFTQNNKEVEALRMALRMVCCHVINRIFELQDLRQNFNVFYESTQLNGTKAFFEAFKIWVDKSQDIQSLTKQIRHIFDTFFAQTANAQAPTQ